MMKSIILLSAVVAVAFSAPAPKAGVVGVVPLAARSIHPSPLALPAVLPAALPAAVPALSAPLVAAAPLAAVATAHSSQAVARTYNAAISAVPVPAAYAYPAHFAYAPFAAAPFVL